MRIDRRARHYVSSARRYPHHTRRVAAYQGAGIVSTRFQKPIHFEEPNPMKRTLTALALAIGAGACIAPAQEITWKKIQITDKFHAEGMAAGDFNKDGKMDVVYGPFWYE